MVKRIRCLTQILLFAALAPFACAAGPAAAPLRVVCTTTALEAVIAAVGQGLVEVTSVIPEQSCPGHTDILPSVAARLRLADLVLCHDFEPEQFVARLLRLSANPSLEVKRVSVSGFSSSWMVPDTHIQAVEQVCSLLCKARPQQAALFQHNAASYSAEVIRRTLRVRRRLESSGLRGTAVVASVMQQDLLRWLGFKVVASYGRDEDITVRSFREVVEHSRAAGVRFVIDNLQSGAQTGEPLARELHARHLVFSNFPRSSAGRVSYLKTFEDNLMPILQE